MKMTSSTGRNEQCERRKVSKRGGEGERRGEERERGRGREREKETERERERQTEYSEVLCYSHASKCPPTTPPPESGQPSLQLAPASCLSYEPVMSLAATSLTLNLNSQRIIKEASQ